MEQIKLFFPMPEGKPDEKLWPRIVQEGTATAHRQAEAKGFKLSKPWHQASEWTDREIGGMPMSGWTLTYDLIEV